MGERLLHLLASMLVVLTAVDAVEEREPPSAPESRFLGAWRPVEGSLVVRRTGAGYGLSNPGALEGRDRRLFVRPTRMWDTDAVMADGSLLSQSLLDTVRRTSWRLENGTMALFVGDRVSTCLKPGRGGTLQSVSAAGGLAWLLRWERVEDQGARSP